MTLGAGRRRGRARAVLRLGAARTAPALMPTRERLHDSGRARREGARAPQGRHRHRHGRARLLREVPQALHGRLGPRHHQRHAVRGACCPAMPPESIKGLAFDNVRDKPLRDIWLNGSAFQKYRGTDWMKEPCRSCPRREVDCGGCRCQAFALTGDAANTDPACSLVADALRSGRRWRRSNPTPPRPSLSTAVPAAPRPSRQGRKPRLRPTLRPRPPPPKIPSSRPSRGGASLCSVRVQKTLGTVRVCIR